MKIEREEAIVKQDLHLPLRLWYTTRTDSSTVLGERTPPFSEREELWLKEDGIDVETQGRVDAQYPNSMALKITRTVKYGTQMHDSYMS